jgi:hypothetical protein
MHDVYAAPGRTAGARNDVGVVSDARFPEQFGVLLVPDGRNGPAP